ncbi:major tail protein [Ligilactobacillus agilis]|uniref:major tail protein n=1 Tax=Ligilactobacillus agilis TaxID=1601 RepID=UPI00067E953A|nr:major tail protein [Ligilactobacillus agilis]
MADAKKVAKFGVSDFEYGKVDDGDLVKTTRKIPGLSEVKLELTNELKTLAADNGPYLVLSGGITEAKQTINVYDVDSQMKQDLYGVEIKKGVEVYSKNMTPNYVATLFRMKMSNGKDVWIGMLKGMFSLPGLTSKTQDGAPDPEADEIVGNFIPRGGQETVVLVGRSDNEGFDLDTFRKAVFPTSDTDAKALETVSGAG